MVETGDPRTCRWRRPGDHGGGWLSIDGVLDAERVTPQELSDVALHVTFYCYAGWPAAVNAERLLTAAFRAREVEFADLE